MHTSANFILRGGDAAFANRQRLLFDQLSIAENSCNKRVISEVDDCERSLILRDDQKQKRETKRFRGKESIFKRPEGPAPRANFRNIPDYHRNPHKWVKYSLDDVSSEDMTERSNMQAAMSFLKELKARRENEEVDQCEEKMDIEFESDLQDSVEFKSKKQISTSQIRFRKPQIKDVAENSKAIVTDSTLVFKSSKIILPEYVVGQRPKKISKQNRPVVKVDRSKQLRLDHLQEPDEEEDNRDV
ncbi:protein TSSC4 [Cataglyphis hispanica]|uniref:protein TSSC4 n=1 Tax=Cataglyphis hispanica TaxID=1086592 RepID=UPI00217F2B02|nr:protein TSSC4 [Cataglyphis hispanica]